MAQDLAFLRLLQCPYERDDRSFCDDHQRLLSAGKCPFGHRWQEGGPAAGQRTIPPYICTEQLYDRCQAPLVTVGQSQSLRRCGQGFHATRAQLANLDTLNVVLVNVLWEAGTTTDQCAICLAALGSSSPGRFGHLANCTHVFCGRCLVDWLDQDHTQCPVCRAACDGMLIWSRVLTDRQERTELFGLLRAPRVAPRPALVHIDWGALPRDEAVVPAPLPPLRIQAPNPVEPAVQPNPVRQQTGVQAIAHAIAPALPNTLRVQDLPINLTINADNIGREPANAALAGPQQANLELCLICGQPRPCLRHGL